MQTRCPHCLTVLVSSTVMVGSVTTCPHCGQPFEVEPVPNDEEE